MVVEQSDFWVRIMTNKSQENEMKEQMQNDRFLSS